MARTKPFVKVHISVADHAKTSGVWADLAMRGMLVELWRKSGEKYAAKRDNWVPLKPTDRMDIACSTDLSQADVALKSLCSRMRYAVKRFSNRWEVNVRNFSKKQGFEDKELDKNSTTSSPSYSYAEAEANTEAEKTKSAPAAPRKRSAPKTPVPDLLSSDDAIRVTDWAARRSPPITPEQLQYGWDVFKAQARSKGYAYVDHAQAFQNALGATGEAWALKGYGASPTGEPESPALAKERRQREHLREALRRSTAPDSNPPLLALDGGRR